MAPENIILIGASTGGPGLIETIVSSLPQKMNAALIIAQHMDKISLISFTKRLGRLRGHRAKLTDRNTPLENGVLHILSDTSILKRQKEEISLKIVEDESGYYHPTIDTLFLSAAKLKGVTITAFLLSGIGSDGAAGMLKLKEAGQETIAQDESTSIVYGMPKAAAELGAATRIASIEEIVSYLKRKV